MGFSIFFQSVHELYMNSLIIMVFDALNNYFLEYLNPVCQQNLAFPADVAGPHMFFKTKHLYHLYLFSMNSGQDVAQ